MTTALRKVNTEFKYLAAEGEESEGAGGGYSRFGIA